MWSTVRGERLPCQPTFCERSCEDHLVTSHPRRDRAILLVGLLTALLVGLLVAGCSGAPPSTPSPSGSLTPSLGGHTHGTAYGDGLATEVHDFRMTDIRLPARAGTEGAVSFEILNPNGKPVTTMVEDQTKLLHLYVVRSDLTAFRHLHPTFAKGRWSVPATLPTPGDYRVIAEFSATTAGHTDHIVLGGEGSVGGRAPAHRPADLGSSDGAVRVAIDGNDDALLSKRLRVRVSDRHGRPVKLGAYLGTTGHITGFQVATGAMTHLHPIGLPTIEHDAAVLNLHTALTLPGPYVFFVQVRADGFLHTLRVATDIG
jgi:hypothetical protein